MVSRKWKPYSRLKEAAEGTIIVARVNPIRYSDLCDISFTMLHKFGNGLFYWDTDTSDWKCFTGPFDFWYQIPDLMEQGMDVEIVLDIKRHNLNAGGLING